MTQQVDAQPAVCLMIFDLETIVAMGVGDKASYYCANRQGRSPFLQINKDHPLAG